jgi:uracil-DNA glycosylase family 4
MPFNVRGLNVSPNCAQCPCAKNGKPFKAVPGFGGTEGFCLVGEAPGSEELAQGYPFIGPSGRVVNRALRQAGIDRGKIFITNALLCKRPASDEAFTEAVACCRPRLEADLAMAKPTAICALGGTAMRALQLPIATVSLSRGTIQFSPLVPQVPVIGALHPAALLHGGAGEVKGGKQKMNVDAQALFLFADIAKAHKVAIGEVDPIWSDDIQVVHEASEVRTVMRSILTDIYEWGMLGLDLEWFCEDSKNALDALGANAHKAVITWVGIACAKRGVSFKWEALLEDNDVTQCNDLEGMQSGLTLLQAAMEDENLPKLMHNKQADVAVWEANVGPMFGDRHDTMLAHHVACPGIDHELQQVASQYLCIPPWKVEHAREREQFEAQLKEEARVQKLVEAEAKKADKKAKHEAANAEKKAKAERDKAERVARHNAENAQKKADKAARKALEKAEKATKKADRQLNLGGVQ